MRHVTIFLVAALASSCTPELDDRDCIEKCLEKSDPQACYQACMREKQESKAEEEGELALR